MSELETVANFNNTADVNMWVMDAGAVPDELWSRLQSVHREFLRSQLPKDQWDRADDITGNGDPGRYRDTRVNPNLLVGNDWNDDQLFRRPLVAVAFAGKNRPVGAVLTTNNTSGSEHTPEKYRLLEAKAKMLVPLSLGFIPKIGGRRYVHFREAYIHPDLQDPMDVDEGVTVESAITLAGIYHSLALRNPRQLVNAYKVLGDPADVAFVQTTEVIGMQDIPDSEHESSLPGYKGKQITARAGVGQLMNNILNIPYMRDGISSIDVKKHVTKRTLAAVERAERKERDVWLRS